MIIEIKEKWPEILETIKSEHEISDVSFKTWLQPLIPYDTHDNVLFLLLPVHPPFRRIPLPSLGPSC